MARMKNLVLVAGIIFCQTVFGQATKITELPPTSFNVYLIADYYEDIDWESFNPRGDLKEGRDIFLFSCRSFSIDLSDPSVTLGDIDVFAKMPFPAITISLLDSPELKIILDSWHSVLVLDTRFGPNGGEDQHITVYGIDPKDE